MPAWEWVYRFAGAASLVAAFGCEREAPTRPPATASPPASVTAPANRTAVANADAGTSPRDVARALLEVEVLPAGRVRLGDGRVVTDDAFIASLATDETVVRERAAGKEVMVLLKPADGASIERTHALIERIKIPGVLTGSPLPP